MKHQHKLLLALLCACATALALVVAAWANATPAIDWWVFGSGGAPSSGGAVAMADTLGQPVIGPSSGGAVALHAGYWYQHEAALPQLAITKAAIPIAAQPGVPVLYTIVVSNNGDADATGGVVSDTPPAQLTFAGPVTLDPPGAGTTGAPPLLVTGATISAAGRITVTFPVTVNLYLPPDTLVTNTAAVSCSEVPTPVEASAAITVANVKPSLGTIDPSSGSGPTGATTYFTTTWKDDNGWDDLKQCYFHIGADASIVGNVTLLYNAAKNRLWLRSDDGTTWLGGCEPGTEGTIENSQAILDCKKTRQQGADDTLGLRWAIEFKPGYEGDKKTGLKCKDRSKARAKASWKGTWEVTAGG
jgi:uncharacterized repeat protein (TIGR01451 family)